MPPKLGIFAGGGDLPARLAALCRESGRPYFIVAFRDQCDAATVANAPHGWFRMGAAQMILSALRREGVSDLVMVGRIKRPRLRDIRPDLAGIGILMRIGRFFFSGDDALLRAVTRELEDRQGFRVRGVHEFMEELVAPQGALGRIAPDEAAVRDIVRGAVAARELGERDLGQAVIVRGAEVVALEDSGGTDAMLRRCAAPATGRSGVLVKMRKPHQDSRVDLPTIGPDTVRLAAEAGLAGIAVEAGHSLVVDRAETVRTADALGLFVVGTTGND